jgi:ribosomal protein S7
VSVSERAYQQAVEFAKDRILAAAANWINWACFASIGPCCRTVSPRLASAFENTG